MRLYTFVFRVSVLAGLAAGSLVCGGWKWDLVPH